MTGVRALLNSGSLVLPSMCCAIQWCEVGSMHSGRHSTPIVDSRKRGQLRVSHNFMPSPPGARRSRQHPFPSSANAAMHTALLPVDAPIYYYAIPRPHCHICLLAPNPNTAPARTVCYMNPPPSNPAPTTPCLPLQTPFPAASLPAHTYRSDTQFRHPRSRNHAIHVPQTRGNACGAAAKLLRSPPHVV